MPAEIVDPDLQAQVIREFNLKGALSPFNLTETVVPIIDIGRLLSVAVQEVVTPGQADSVQIGIGATDESLPVSFPSHVSTNAFEDSTAAPAAATVLVDTGQITTASEYFIQFSVSHDDAALRHFELQWRDGANAANLAVYPFWTSQDKAFWLYPSITGSNQRFRLVNVTAIAGLALSYITVARGRRALAD